MAFMGRMQYQSSIWRQTLHKLQNASKFQGGWTVVWSRTSKRHLGILDKFFKKHPNSQVVLPGRTSPVRAVPSHIALPNYAVNGTDELSPVATDLKTESEQELMRRSCGLAKHILDESGKQIGVGVTTDELDRFVHELCIKNNCYPSPLNYRGFPKSVCTSVNNVAVHGIPDDRRLCNGDIISIDISVYFQGFHGDCASTFAVGNVDAEAHHLMFTARECLNSGIARCQPGCPFKEIGTAVRKTAQDFGCEVVPAFCGHGIGSYFHGPPDIYHCENEYPGEMKQGMIFTIEPVITEGGQNIVILEDGWTAITEDGYRTAQYEHTILITSSGYEILTCEKNKPTNADSSCV